MFNWIFPVLWVISVYFFIVNPLFHIYPTSTLGCVTFALFPPYSLLEFPTDVPYPWQGFISINVCSPYPPCAKWVPLFLVGDATHLVTLTNADAMAPHFYSSYFCHDSWSIFHHLSDNSPWDTHLSPLAKPPLSQHEVQRDWEAAWRIYIPSPWWGEYRLPEPKRQYQGTGRFCK